MGFLHLFSNRPPSERTEGGFCLYQEVDARIISLEISFGTIAI